MLTTREAADRLGIKPRSVAKAIKRGLIEAEKRGRDYWIEDEEIERYAVERRPQHRPKSVPVDRYISASKDSHNDSHHGQDVDN